MRRPNGRRQIAPDSIRWIPVSWSTIAGILLFGLITRNSGANCSSFPMSIGVAASGMMDVFKKMWPDALGVRMEHILRNVLMALLEQTRRHTS